MGRREDTTQRILDGAASVFAKGGYAGTSMEEIAAAAGVSKLLLYRDFAGKRELYQAVLDRTSGWLKERVPAEAANALALADVYERGSEEMLRDLEPDPVLRRWAARVVVQNTYQMIIAWLEH